MKIIYLLIIACTLLIGCNQPDRSNINQLPVQSEMTDIKGIQSQLREMARADATMREEFDAVYGNRNKTPEGKSAFRAVLKRMREQDIAHHDELNLIVEMYGWIDPNRFGKQASRDAWLITQHTVHDKGVFQKKMFSLMEPGTNVDSTQYALLSDRIAVIFDKADQEYGTQGKCENGDWKASPIRDFDTLDDRRLAIAFHTFAEYEAIMDAKCLDRFK